MDREDLDIEFTPENQETAQDTLEKVAGRRITHVELLEDNTQALIKICFSKDKDDYLLIHAEGANLYLVEAKPNQIH